MPLISGCVGGIRRHCGGSTPALDGLQKSGLMCGVVLCLLVVRPVEEFGCLPPNQTGLSIYSKHYLAIHGFLFAWKTSGHHFSENSFLIS